MNLALLRTDRVRRLSREGSWIVFGQAAAIAGSLFGVRLITGILEPTAYGELALGMTLATLVNQLVFGPLGNGVMRFYAPAQEKGQLGGYLRAVRRFVAGASAVVLVMAVLAALGLWVLGRAEWIALATAALVFSMLAGWNSILNGIQNAARQRSVVALHQGIEPWARFLTAAGLLVWLGAASSIAMAGYGVAVLAVLGSQYLFFRGLAGKRGQDGSRQVAWESSIWSYSWPFAAWGGFTWAQVVSDRWALGLFATTREVGLYAVLFQLGYYPMSTATGMAAQLLAPVFFQRAGDGTDSRRNAQVDVLARRLTGLSLGVTGVAVVCGAVFHRLVFRAFVSSDYAGISYLLPWVLLAGGLFAAAQTMTLNLMSRGQTGVLVPAKVTTALLGVGCNLIGAYWFGVKGIVGAGVVFSTAYLAWIVALVKRENATALRQCQTQHDPQGSGR